MRTDENRVRRQLQECPVCGSGLKIKVFQCPSCRTKIEGDFPLQGSRLGSLSQEDQEFIEMFMMVRGSIKEMEKVLGVSYPTVRGMLDAINTRLGHAATPAGLTETQRLEILAQLDRGEISASEAAVKLQGPSL